MSKPADASRKQRPTRRPKPSRRQPPQAVSAMAADDGRRRLFTHALGYWPAALALVIWFAAVGWPMAAIMPAAVAALGNSNATDVLAGDSPAPKSLGELLMVSAGWAGAAAVCAAIVGWLPGRWLGGLLARRSFIAAAAMI